MALAGFVTYRAVRFGMNWRRRRQSRTFRLGFASGDEIREMLSAAAIIKKAPSVRPSYRGRSNIDPRDVGFYLGRDTRSRQELWASVEDVFIVLAPPRQGKDVHFCAPYTIDAPGACIVTSTRADAFSNTYTMRRKMGEVYVFDPTGLTNWPEQLRWSPVNGCEDPTIAVARANAFVMSSGLEIAGEAAFFVSAAVTVLQTYLHAAALGKLTLKDVIRWSTQSSNPEPWTILRRLEPSGYAAAGWASRLETLASGDNPLVRDYVWSMLVQSMSCFSNPKIVEACSPPPSEQFDLRKFLSGRNTLYILGKDKKAGSIAPLVTAMMEDILDEARRIAAGMPGSRLDPALTVELNEAAHIAPMPNLPAYMGDSGGNSIALHVYLQSLSQARAKWGEHEAMIMWDNAATRVIMGGAGNVEDLEDIARLMGEVRIESDVDDLFQGRRNPNAKRHVLSPDEVRTLKFGTAVVVGRAARPVEVNLTPWWKRKDGKEIAAGKAEVEKLIVKYGHEARERDKVPDFDPDGPTSTMPGTSPTQAGLPTYGPPVVKAERDPAAATTSGEPAAGAST